MRAVVFDPAEDRFGLAHLSRPKPGKGEALIEVEACGLNPVDAKIRYWKTGAVDMDEAWVAGLDVSGVIVELGQNTSPWKVGDRVLCHGNMLSPYGGFAEFSLQRVETLLPHPKLDSVVAAASPCAGWTAWQALVDKLRAGERESLLIFGASGGVGTFAVQLAAQFGVRQIFAACSAETHDYVRALGATRAIDYRTEDVAALVREETGGRGVEAALDLAGGDNDLVCVRALDFGGHFCAAASLARPEAYEDAFSRALSFHQVALGSGHRLGSRARESMLEAGRRVSALLEDGVLQVPEIRVVSLEDCVEVLPELLEKRRPGKIVARIG